MITPYLKPFNTQGGTLYVFPSVSKDLTRTLVSNDYEFKFSHFACLNIPDICEGIYSEDNDGDSSNDLPRGLYVETLRSIGAPTVQWTSDGMCKAITEGLQNYVMNFETGILNGMGDNDDYDNDILTNVSEKVFWNWMKKVGAIKFNESGTEEVYNSYADRVVQYIGNIDIMNTVEINGDAFEELYLHIPSTAGASTSVYFRTGEQTDNKNYLNKNFNFGGGEFIIGRNDGDENPYDGSISIKSFVDNDAGTNIYAGDIGHTIDFRDTSYTDGINNMNALSLEDFEFNAVLIYYDIFEKTSTPGVKRTATNLYGILFLDNVSIEGGRNFFQRYPKKKETVYGNGNSYALMIDLKVDTIGDANCEHGDIPDLKENITSMVLYTKALEQLQRCIDIFYTQQREINELYQRVEALENLSMGVDSVSSLKADIERLYNICDGNGIVDTATLLGLIDSNTRKLDNIMNGGKDLKLQYDTDVIQPGVGIGIKKSINKVVISSEQRYSINTVYDGLTEDTEITPDNMVDTSASAKVCRIPLKPGENFATIYINDTGNSETNFNINIDETDCNWEVGQSLKIYFVCEVGSLLFEDPDTTGIMITPTDGVLLEIPGSEFEGNNLIEIVCVGEFNDSKKFIYLMK